MAVITISRQFGAGGITLGQMVAERLGYTFFDNEIIQMVADKAKVSAQWVESMEKEAGAGSNGSFPAWYHAILSIGYWMNGTAISMKRYTSIC